MPLPRSQVLAFLHAAGYEDPSREELEALVPEVRELHAQILASPEEAVARVLGARRKLKKAQQSSQKSLEAVIGMKKLMASMVHADTILCRPLGVRRELRAMVLPVEDEEALELDASAAESTATVAILAESIAAGLTETNATDSNDNDSNDNESNESPAAGTQMIEVVRVICHLGGSLRELAVHPDVDPDALEALLPWEYVAIHAKEMVVVGIYRHPDLFAHAHGEVAEFKGYHDRLRGLVRVARHGQDEEIVVLAPHLRDTVLEPTDRIILCRESPSWVIGISSGEETRSRFEEPIDRIETRLEDLAGLDEVIEHFVQDVLLCLVRPDLRETYDLRPLRGAILHSVKPGMGKTALVRALARWLADLGQQLNFDVALYVVKPNELKSMWHGGDAKLVREDLCGSLRARRAQPRTRPLFQLVVLDEIDSLGRRAGGSDGSGVTSSAHNDAVQSLLVEMDGLIQEENVAGQPPAQTLWIGLTNRIDLLDDAMRRPARFGDLVLAMPQITPESAEGILSIYARGSELPWNHEETVRDDLDDEEIRRGFLRPALSQVFSSVVLRYTTDRAGQRSVDVTAGEIMAGVHYMTAMQGAKKDAARRRLLQVGVPGIDVHDVTRELYEQALSAARQMEADPQALVRQLELKVPITGVEVVAEEEHGDFQYLHLN